MTVPLWESPASLKFSFLETTVFGRRETMQNPNGVGIS